MASLGLQSAGTYADVFVLGFLLFEELDIVLRRGRRLLELDLLGLILEQLDELGVILGVRLEHHEQHEFSQNRVLLLGQKVHQIDLGLRPPLFDFGFQQNLKKKRTMMVLQRRVVDVAHGQCGVALHLEIIGVAGVGDVLAQSRQEKGQFQDATATDAGTRGAEIRRYLQLQAPRHFSPKMRRRVIRFFEK